MGRQEVRGEGVLILVAARRPEWPPAQVRDEGDAGRQRAAVVLGRGRVHVVRLRQLTETNSSNVKLHYKVQRNMIQILVNYTKVFFLDSCDSDSIVF